MSGVIKDAGKGSWPAPYNETAASTRRARLLATATQLRSAKSDEEAADALEAVLELSKD